MRTPPPLPPIRLLSLPDEYRGLAHQDEAIRWLQGQIRPDILQTFALLWRYQVTLDVVVFSHRDDEALLQADR